jgi:hypothetical protein
LANVVAKRQATLKEPKQRYGAQALANTEARRPTMRGFKIANAELGQQIRTHQAETQALKAQLTALPKRVPVKDVVDGVELDRTGQRPLPPSRARGPWRTFYFVGPTSSVILLILPVNRVSGPMPIPSATGV